MNGHSLAGMSVKRERIENDYYATPTETTKQLLERVKLRGSVWEPACGEGHISKVIIEAYPEAEVYSSDLINRGYGESGVDFLNHEGIKFDNIITNPPFKLAKEFILKALENSNDKVIMFAKIQLLEGVSRKSMFSSTPLKYVYVFSARQNPLRNGSPVDENGKKWSSTMCFAWYVWEHGYEGEPIIRWI